MPKDVERDGQVGSLLLDLLGRAVMIDSPAFTSASVRSLDSTVVIKELEDAPEKVHKQANRRRQAMHIDEPDL